MIKYTPYTIHFYNFVGFLPSFPTSPTIIPSGWYISSILPPKKKTRILGVVKKYANRYKGLIRGIIIICAYLEFIKNIFIGTFGN